jgi:Ca-activated chloride channel family protein
VTFLWPFMLPLLAIVPLTVAAYIVLERRRTPYAVRFTNIETLAAVAGGTASWRRWVPPALVFLALATLLVALARPEVAVTANRNEGNVILAIDSSGSMFAEDVEPTRLGAAQEAVRRFLDKLPDRYRVGVVTFSSEAQVVAPLTRDRDAVRNAVDYLVPGRGTAIGDGLARAVELAQSANETETGSDGTATPPPTDASGRPVTAILLLSDGSQTVGTLQPYEGAQRAKQAHIPVYTVALGTPEGTITLRRFGFDRTIPVPPDEVTLQQIARDTDGEFFTATTGKRLSAVYAHLGSSLGRYDTRRETTDFLLAAGGVLLLSAGLLGGLWHPRLP